MTERFKRSWYRNYRGKYHATREDWVRSGKAVCGADIKNPAFALDRPTMFFDKLACRHCDRKLRK